jgi:biotin carboxylase
MPLLVIGSGRPDYRRDILEALEGFDVHLIVDAPATWELDLIRSATTVPQLAAARLGYTSSRLLQAARRVARAAGVQGVLTFDEQLVECTAEIASMLGLPGPTSRAARNCRDKSVTRALLREAGIRQPEVQVVLPGASSVARTRFPAVVKPASLAGSVGVSLVHDQAEMERAIAEAREAAGAASRAPMFKVLVEDYVDGEEISVDTVAEGGRHHIVQIARKRLTDDGRFVETGHAVDARDPLWDDSELRSTVHRVHDVLGFGHGVTHAELRLGAGGPTVIEVNARVAGGFLPLLAELSGGAHLARLAAEVALGHRPSLQRPARSASVRFSSNDALPTSRPALEPGEVLLVEKLSPAPGPAGRTWYAVAAAATSARAEALVSAVE